MTDVAVPRPGGAVEVELKFRMSGTGAGTRLIAADDLAGFTALAPAATVQHEDRYVDTADGRLAAAGYAGRFRSAGDVTVLTLKSLRSDAAGGALHRREELEGPAIAEVPPDAWPDSAARTAVLELLGGAPLTDLVTVRQTRHKRTYGREGVVVELSVDDVEIVAGERVLDRFAELEVELIEGGEAALEPLADLLAEVEELVPAESSKLERALEAVEHDRAGTGEPGADDERSDGADERSAAAGGDLREAPQGPRTSVAGGPVEVPAPGTDATATEAPEPVVPRITVPKAPGVIAEDHLAEAGRKVLRFHLARMIAREPGTRIGRDDAELHAMRVATRRQRAAWRVFGESFDRKATARHRVRLREVARDLGAVRDLDVLIGAAETHRDQLPAREAAAFDRLIEGWRGQRDGAREVLLRELDSGRYRKWVDAYVEFVQAEGAGALPVGPTQPHRVRDTMPSRIWAAYEGRSGLRASASMGRRDHPPRPPDRGQVAALHAGVRARGARS